METTPLRVATIYNLHMVKFDPQKHHRRSIRLKGYDYSATGTYFVTIVAWRRECLFGEVMNGEMRLSPYGEIVQKWWEEIPVHFANVETGAFVVMPNHVHGIIFIVERRGTGPVPEDNQNLNPMDVSELKKSKFGRGDPAPTDANAWTNCGIFQISIHEGNE